MMFSIGKDGLSISRVQSKWSPRELDIENFLMNGPGSEDGLLNESILGEELLLVSNQVRTRDKKRADILALDRQGGGVIIELKRDQAMAGVETQALQYLAAFSPFRGVDFTHKFGEDPRALEERIKRFLGDVPFEQVNRRHRVILVARSFDRTLFSMGKWFGSNGVAFRCIAYTPFEVEGEHFISFSVAFDHSPPETFPLSFGSQAREPDAFWHNIGAAHEDARARIVPLSRQAVGILRQLLPFTAAALGRCSHGPYVVPASHQWRIEWQLSCLQKRLKRVSLGAARACRSLCRRPA